MRNNAGTMCTSLSIYTIDNSQKNKIKILINYDVSNAAKINVTNVKEYYIPQSKIKKIYIVEILKYLHINSSKLYETLGLSYYN